MHPYPTDRKRRAQGACDYCRKKKVRCDSATRPGNVCYNCQNADVECTHNSEQKKRGPRVGTIRKHPSESVQALVSAILAEPDTYSVPTEPDNVRRMLVDLSLCVRGLERQLARWRRTVQDISAADEPAPDDAADSDSSDDTSTETGSISSLPLTLNDPELPRRHFGKSSNFLFLRTASDIKREMMGERVEQFMERRPEFWNTYPWERQLPKIVQAPLIFPESDLLRSLIDLWFTHAHPYVPILHRPTFQRQISEDFHMRNYDFGSVVLCICAIASRYSEDSRNSLDGVNPIHSAGWPWYRQVINVRETFTELPSLYRLQYFCLSAMYLTGTSLFHATWGRVGLAIRLAQEVGVHRKQKKQPRTVQNELWRRTFWMLLNLDVVASINFGRPRATTGDDFDLEPPADCDDEFWENDENLAQSFVQPPNTPSKMSFFLCYSRLLEIAGFAHRMLYSATKMYIFKKLVAFGPNWDQKLVTQVNAALNQWMSSLPEHLKWNPDREDGIFHRQSAILHSIFYWTQIQVHKQFIPRSHESAVTMFPSLAICANAARCSTRILECVHQTKFLILSHIIFPAFTSAIILILNIWRNKRLLAQADVSRDMQDVQRCLRIIGEYEQRYQVAGRIKDTLVSVLSIVDLYFQDSRTISTDSRSPSSDASLSSEHNNAAPTTIGDTDSIHPITNSNANSNPLSFTPQDPAPNTFYNSNVQNLHTPTVTVSPQGTTHISPGMGPNRHVQSYNYQGSSMNAQVNLHPSHPQHLSVHTQMNVTPPSISSAIPEDEWRFFMSNVDELLHWGNSNEGNLNAPQYTRFPY